MKRFSQFVVEAVPPEGMHDHAFGQAGLVKHSTDPGDYHTWTPLSKTDGHSKLLQNVHDHLTTGGYEHSYVHTAPGDSAGDSGTPGWWHAHQYDSPGGSRVSVNMAGPRITHVTYSPGQGQVSETAGDIQELSKKTLGSYLTKSAKSLRDASYDRGDVEGQRPPEDDDEAFARLQKAEITTKKRMKGIGSVAGRLREKTDLQELSKETLRSYVEKARMDAKGRRQVSEGWQDSWNEPHAQKMIKKAGKHYRDLKWGYEKFGASESRAHRAAVKETSKKTGIPLPILKKHLKKEVNEMTAGYRRSMRKVDNAREGKWGITHDRDGKKIRVWIPSKETAEKEAGIREGAERGDPYAGLSFGNEGAIPSDHQYNKKSVDKAIKSSRKKISGKEAKKIHSLLKGWRK